MRIRLRRTGSKQAATYRLVVSESTRTPQGSFVENLGTYDPGKNPAAIRIDVPRTDEWIRKGAQPSGTVRTLLEKARRAQA